MPTRAEIRLVGIFPCPVSELDVVLFWRSGFENSDVLGIK